MLMNRCIRIMNYACGGDDFHVPFHNEYSDLVVDFLFR